MPYANPTPGVAQARTTRTRTTRTTNSAILAPSSAATPWNRNTREKFSGNSRHTGGGTGHATNGTRNSIHPATLTIHPAVRTSQLSLALIGTVLLSIPAAALDLNTIGSLRIENGRAIVEFANDPGKYYLLEYSDDLRNWVPADMSLGAPSELEIVPGVQKGFFRAIPYGKHAPLDSDGDGIDDVYELRHREFLNPLDPTDGTKLAPNGGGLTNYQVYLDIFRITSYKILQRESREMSVFNFGSPSATFEANGREHSVFNFGSPSATTEANSRELSLYNGQHIPYNDLAQIETREVSVFNLGQPAPGPGAAPALAEAITHEVSVYNGQNVPYSDLAQIETREISVFNSGSPSAPIEAISREVSVLNFEEP